MQVCCGEDLHVLSENKNISVDAKGNITCACCKKIIKWETAVK